MMRRGSGSTLIVAALIGLLVMWARAGSLTPPAGSVAPTMKTLDEISTQISSIQVAGGAAPIKRVIRGVLDFPAGTNEVTQGFSPNVDPAKSVVTLSSACALGFPVASNAFYSRSGTCVINLTSSQLTIRVDAGANVVDSKVSFQIVEYN